MIFPNIWNYQVTIAFEPEEEGSGYYIAWLEDFGLVSCSAMGDDVPEAIENLERIYTNIVQYYAETGREIPKPSRDPALTVDNSKPVQIEDEVLFKLLVHKWFLDTMFMSSPTQMLENPAMRRIIGMGEKAIPWILEELKNRPSFLFLTLHKITGDAVDIAEKDRGKIDKIVNLWLEWGNKRGSKND